MNYFRSLLPSYIPPEIAEKGELMVWRERIIQTIGIAAMGVAIFVFFFLLPGVIAEGNPVMIGAYISLVVYLAALIFIRRLPYAVRGNLLLIAILTAGVISFIQYGLSGNGRVLLLTYTILTAALFGLRPGLNALGLSMLTMGIFGFGMVTGFIPTPAPEVLMNTSNPREWLIGSVFLSFGAIMGITSMAVLIRGMQTGMTKESKLSTDLQKERSSLELRVFQRTQDLQRRLVQIRTAAEISQSIVTVLKPEQLLQQVVDLIKDRFGLYYVGVFLLDEKNENAILRAGTGEAGRQMLDAGHFLPIGGTSMIGWTTSNRKARIALDVGKDAVRFNNPYLPKTRSELAIPIISRTESIGAMTIQSTEENAFDQDDILVLQGIADSLATALENARLFVQTEKSLEEISTLNQAYLKKSWADILQNYGPINYTYVNREIVKKETGASQSKHPLRLRNQVIGYLNVESTEEELTEADLALIDAVTAQTALALENARLLEDSQRRAAQEQKINALSVQFSQANTMEEILKAAMNELILLPAVKEISVQLVPPASHHTDNVEIGKIKGSVA